MPDEQFVQLESVRVDANGAAEMDGVRKLVFVPRAEIERLEVAHGSGSQRPIITGIIGALLLAFSLVPIWMLIRALLGTGIFEVHIIAACGFFFLALWLLNLALRKRWMIVVHTRNGGTRKLLFHEMKDRTAIENFLTNARSRFGYGG